MVLLATLHLLSFLREVDLFVETVLARYFDLALPECQARGESALLISFLPMRRAVILVARLEPQAEESREEALSSFVFGNGFFLFIPLFHLGGLRRFFPDPAERVNVLAQSSLVSSVFFFLSDFSPRYLAEDSFFPFDFPCPSIKSQVPSSIISKS